MRAYDAKTLETSSELYKVLSDKTDVTPANFTEIAKKAVVADVQKSLPTYTITKQEAGVFASGQAYSVTAVDRTNGASVIETLVLHKTSHGNNYFVIVHGLLGTSVDLRDLQNRWIWK